MLTKPDIKDELIIARVQDEYNVQVSSLTFLPIGADLRTAVYRIVADDGTAYFLKLRRNFNEVIVRVPLFLKQHGVEEIIASYPTQSNQYWADFGNYTIILYPYIEGKNGFEAELTNKQKRMLGTAFRKIHLAQVSLELREAIRKETFSSEWQDELKSYQLKVERETFIEPTAAKLSAFMNAKRGEISHLIERTEQLASEIQSTPLEFVLCHTDIHGGNILIGNTGELYIVDWDDPILAPKERDLMFIGGGIDEIWMTQKDIASFYEGYGQIEINYTTLAYYRYVRVVEDLVVICKQLLSSHEGGADREQAYRWFTSNFEIGNTIDIAGQTLIR